MDPTLGIIALIIGAATLVVLWVRVRAYEALAAEESALRVDATSSAIETLQERLQPVSEGSPTERSGRRRRRGKRRGRRRS